MSNEKIDWNESTKRILAGWSVFLNPLVLPKIQAAIELERAKKHASAKKAFKEACKEVIDNEELIDSMWKNIKKSLVNPINGYCW